MQLQTHATLKITERNSFKDQEGKDVEYYANFLKDGEGQVLEIPGTTDFSEHEGRDGVATIRARKREGGGFKLSLVDFIPEATIV